jgi:DNA invertase Pin-like site-specific DNA recombinase
MRNRQNAQPLPHRAAIYARVSTIEQAQKGTVSLDTQVDGCKAWALSHGYPLVADEHIFTDTHSGEEYYERPALARLRERAKAREFDVVVV